MKNQKKHEKIAVIKIGTSLLTTPEGKIQLSFMADICEEIAHVQKMGWKIILVSSGAMASGQGVLKHTAQNLEERPLLSSVGQPIMMGYYANFFRIQGINISQCLLTWRNFEISSEKEMLKNNLETILDNNIIPIVNENDLIADEELKNNAGDNDTLAAKIAVLIKANKLIIFSDVDGLYTGNPQNDPMAKKIDEVFAINDEIFSHIGEKTSKNSLGGMKSKIKSAKIAVDGGVQTTILKGVLGGGNTTKILIEGKKVGTTFYPTS